MDHRRAPGRRRRAVEDEGPGFAGGGAEVAARGESGAGSTGLGLDIARARPRGLGRHLHGAERTGGEGDVDVPGAHGMSRAPRAEGPAWAGPAGERLTRRL